jgi:MauM/NapG family ferredoxin protein
MARKLDEPQGRGDFFKSFGTVLAGFVAQRIEDAVVSAGPELLRPPGALDELAFLTVCTRCDKCLPACPEASIRKAPPGSGLSAGTPYIHPRSMPCFLCTDLPCIPACPEGALLPPRRRVGGQDLEGPRAVRMGLARVKPSLCLTWSRKDQPAEDCRTCVDRCPFPEEAIRMELSEEDGRVHPVVAESHCTGCGLCVFACPTAEPAIVVDPRR